jgi:hypothetical protein
MLGAIKLSFLMPSGIVLSGILLSGIMVNVMALLLYFLCFLFRQKSFLNLDTTVTKLLFQLFLLISTKLECLFKFGTFFPTLIMFALTISTSSSRLHPCLKI